MRPILLTIEGINSFLDRQVVDFERAGVDNIFCVSGCTGSGKTTILDCIILALYENHSERGKLSDYINLRRESGSIYFKFELGGEIYESERTISRKQNKNAMVLRRGGEPIAVGKAATDYLAERIGLEVKEFTNVVVLQQGEFARFLKAKKSERVALISKLFDLGRFDRLYTKFNAKYAALTNEVAVADKTIEEFEGLTEETLKAERQELESRQKQSAIKIEEAAKARKKATETAALAVRYAENLRLIEVRKTAIEAREELDKRLQKGGEFMREVERREKELLKREKERDALVERRTRLSAAADALAALVEKEKAIVLDRAAAEEAQEKANALSKTSKEKAEKATNAIKAAESAKTAGGFEGGDSAWAAEKIADCRHALESADKASEVRDNARTAAETARINRDKSDREVKECERDLEKLKSELDAAKTRERALKETYERALTEDAASLVASSVKVGDRCPVCGGTVKELPRVKSANADLAKAEAESAEKSRLALDEKFAATAQRLSALKEQNKNAVSAEKEAIERLSECERTLAAFKVAELRASLQKLEEYKSLCETARDFATEAQSAASAAALALSTAESAKKTADDRTAEANRERESLKNLTGESADKEREIIEYKLKSLTTEREAVDNDKERAAARIKEIESKIAAETSKINSASERITDCAPITESDSKKAEEEASNAETAAREFAAETSAAAERLNGREKEYHKKNNLIAERKRLEKEREKYSHLSGLFYRNAFAEFVAAEYVKDFTVSASEKLGELTGGKYSLEYDEDSGDFFVRDFLSGNESRSVKTLSGGETFLASLALAIAISRELSQNKDFDFFFIDEGFGTLSPDALDTVTAALERLSRDTLVGIITHRGELIERIPSVVKVLPAEGDEGSRVVQ